MSCARAPQRRPVPTRPVRFTRAERGATAVEFALIAAPFIFMVFCIIEVGIYFMVQVTLDNATAAAARELRTGQVVADGSSDKAGQQQFMTLVCSNMSWLQSQCQSGVSSSTGTQYLVVDVRALGTYASNPSNPSLSGSGGQATGTCYYSGSAGSAVEMRAYYRWQLLTPYLMQAMQTFAGGVAELQSTEVFQVEPDGQTNPSGSTC